MPKFWRASNGLPVVIVSVLGELAADMDDAATWCHHFREIKTVLSRFAQTDLMLLSHGLAPVA